MKDIIEIDLNNPNIYKEKVWGDTSKIVDFVGKSEDEFKDKVIGEIFLTSTHPDGLSRFSNGRVLEDDIHNEESVFGKTVGPKGDFPLLLKVLASKEPLSIQTHYKNKTEAWYTLSDGEMLYGLTKEGEKLLQSVEGRKKLTKIMEKTKTVKEMSKYFNYVKFKAGETYLISAGVVHSLLNGVILEPQKNSNLTIRGGDWGRNDPNRKLHIDDFFESIYPYAIYPKPIDPKYKTFRTDKAEPKNSKHACLVATSDFALDKITLKNGRRMLETFTDRFFIVIVTEGKIDLTNSVVNKEVSKGHIFILGATSNEWTFSGTGEIMLVYVPHIKKGIITPLKNSGYSYKEIADVGGIIQKDNDIYIEMKERGLL